MKISLCAGQEPVAEQLLHDPQGNLAGQLGGKAMTKAVGRCADVQARGLAVGLHQALDFAHRKPAVPAVLQQR